MSTKKIVIVGAGGHGLLAFRKLFQIRDQTYKIYYNTTDWGGSYGLFGRLMECQNGKLNTQLHNHKLPLLPFADPNKLICYYTKLQNKKVAIALDFRSIEPNDFASHIKVLCSFFGFSSLQKIEFEEYFRLFWQFYKVNQNKIGYKDKVNLGYIFHFFVYQSCGSVAGWNTFFQESQIIPANLSIDFSFADRQILVAKDISLVKVHGEDKIDKHKTPLLPETLHLKGLPGHKNQVSNRLLKDLQEAKAVIIPNGSICNWIPLVNIKEVKEALSQKTIIWVTNPFRTKNELINPNYQLFLNEVGLFPKILSSKTNNPNLDFIHSLDQDKNGRYLPDQLCQEIFKLI